MKLVGYQQPTCLCVRMEFVVRIISLSSELYSVSWNCFRSRGSSTLVYVKYCFDLHVECCGSCMVSTTGVGAGKFLGVRKIFARIFPNLPETFWATLLTNFFPQRSWRPFFGMTSLLRDDLGMKKGLHISNKVGRHFCQDFQIFCPNFQGFCQDFQ